MNVRCALFRLPFMGAALALALMGCEKTTSSEVTLTAAEETPQPLNPKTEPAPPERTPEPSKGPELKLGDSELQAKQVRLKLTLSGGELSAPVTFEGVERAMLTVLPSEYFLSVLSPKQIGSSHDTYRLGSVTLTYGGAEVGTRPSDDTTRFQVMIKGLKVTGTHSDTEGVRSVSGQASVRLLEATERYVKLSLSGQGISRTKGIAPYQLEGEFTYQR